MDKFLKAARVAHMDNTAAISAHNGLAKTLRLSLRKHWTGQVLKGEGLRSWSLEWSTQMQRVVVNCYLGPEDSLRTDTLPLLEDLVITNGLEPVNEWASTETDYKAWVLNCPGDCWTDTRSVQRPVGVVIYFHFAQSTQCSKRGTGEYEEIQEIVCR